MGRSCALHAVARVEDRSAARHGEQRNARSACTAAVLPVARARFGRQRPLRPDSFKLPSDLLFCFRHSPSWCSLHLHWLSNYIYGDLLLGTGGLPTQLPPEMASDSVAKRLRVCDHMPGSAVVRSYAIRADERGVKTWRQV